MRAERKCTATNMAQPVQTALLGVQAARTIKLLLSYKAVSGIEVATHLLYSQGLTSVAG